MANIYVRSTDGSDSDDGSTWALAKATLVGAAGIDAAGDTIYVSDNHAESSAAAQSVALAGSKTSPVKIICGDDAAEPPTATATTGTVTTTGNSNIGITGHAYVYGLAFHVGSGAVNSTFLGNHGVYQTFENCDFILNGTGAGGRVKLGAISPENATGSFYRWINCDVKFAAAGQGIDGYQSTLHWRGGSVLSGGTSPTTLFPNLDHLGRGITADVDGVDLVNLSSSANLVGTGSSGNRRITFRNCKLPASWSGSLVTGTPQPGDRIEMFNCDATDTNYRLWVEDAWGSIKHETTIVRTGGASDGTTTISWKMVSGADAEYPHQVLVSPEIVKWNDATGSSKSVTVEIVHDSQGAGSGSKFQNDEIWLEVQYLGTSGTPLSLFANDSKADALATAANQTDSSETWTTTGLTAPVKQKLEVVFTPEEKGFLIVRIVLAKASKTVYIDPELTVA